MMKADLCWDCLSCLQRKSGVRCSGFRDGWLSLILKVCQLEYADTVPSSSSIQSSTLLKPASLEPVCLFPLQPARVL